MKLTWVLCFLATAALAAEPVASTVDVSLKVPGAPHPMGIHVWLSGGGGLPGLNEETVTDQEGQATLLTRRSTFSYVVARRKDCDVTLAGKKTALGIGGTMQVFQRGRMNLMSLGTHEKPDMVFGGNMEMKLKSPGKAKFIFCAEDSQVLRTTLSPDNQPQPAGKVFVTGDFNHWSLVTEDVDPVNGAKEMFDDGGLSGATGDDQIGDGVYSRVLELPPGEHAYAFLVNGIAANGFALLPDPYGEGSKVVPLPTGATVRASVITVTAP
jgi:hypothetical protein